MRRPFSLQPLATAMTAHQPSTDKRTHRVIGPSSWNNVGDIADRPITGHQRLQVC